MSLLDSQYNELMRDYDRIQLINMHTNEERKKEVYNAIPELADIDNELFSLRNSLLKAYLDQNMSKDITSSIDTLTARKQTLISTKFPADYLEPVYHCYICKDTGYINGTKCTCFKKYATDLLYSQSNYKNIDKSHTFENFDYTLFSNEIIPELGISHNSHIRNVTSYCKDFIENFDSRHPNLFLYGNAGVGKTYISDCIFNALISTMHSVIYLTAIEFFNLIGKMTFESKNDYDITEKSVYNSLIDCDLLIIDDLGTELINTFSQSSFFYYINDRLLRKKSTIISSNFDLKALRDGYSERIISRLTGEYTWFKIYGKDLRSIDK